MIHNNYTVIERHLGHVPFIKLKGVKEIPTILIRRKADERQVLIRKEDFDERIHDKIDQPVSKHIEVPIRHERARTVELSRDILESMTLSEIKSLDQWAYVEGHERISTKVSAVKALLVAAGVETAERTLGDIEAELIEKADAAKEQAAKPAGRKGRPTSDHE